MYQRGFSLVQLLVAMTIMAALMGLGYPKLKDSVVKEAVRSARRQVTTQVAITREVAAQRGCSATLHLDEGAASRVWVTACSLNGPGLDTVGTVEQLSSRFGVEMASSTDSIVFTPQGLRRGMSWVGMQFSLAGHSDTLAISPVGRAVW